MHAISSVFLVVIAARGQTPASGGTTTTGLTGVTVKRTKIGNVYIYCGQVLYKPHLPTDVTVQLRDVPCFSDSHVPYCTSHYTVARLYHSGNGLHGACPSWHSLRTATAKRFDIFPAIVLFQFHFGQTYMHV